MKDRKKYAAAAVTAIVVLINILSTMRLLFSVVCPERVQKDLVVDYFKNNLNKAVKFEDISIDYTGDITIDDFNVSITSDFNDNISLIKSRTAVVDLGFFGLLTGRVTINGIDFYDSEITFIKKYGRSHMECVRQILDPEKFIRTVQDAYGEFYMDFHGAELSYRESLRDRHLIAELYDIVAELDINAASVSYLFEGSVKPYRTSGIRRGSFSLQGSVDVGKGDAFVHKIEVDNVDLTYFNDHIQENRNAGIILNGGISADLEVARSRGVLAVKGQTWTNNLTVASISKKFDLISGENMNLDIDAAYNSAQNSCTVRSLSIHDDVARIDASGSFVRNDRDEALKIDFRSNVIDLSELSQNITPFTGIEYGGELQFDGRANIDFRKKKASGMRFNCSLGEFTVSRAGKGGPAVVIDESSMRVKADDTSITADLDLKPLGSDVSASVRTAVSSWVPFGSDTRVTVKSRRLNLDIILEAAVYLIDRAFASAYADKREVRDSTSFLQSALGMFLNKSSVDFSSAADTVFFGKKAAWRNCGLDARLGNGAFSVGEFRAEGYGARYRFGAQGYFNTDQPYIKAEGAVDDFDWTSFYSDSGMKGSMSGTARCDFSYEVSAARLGNILDNSNGNLNVYLGAGEMKNTPVQQNIMNFLRKNGYDAGAAASVTYESITLSLSQRGENFWFSNFGVRGDSLLFNGAGDYLYEGGISSTFGATVRKESGIAAIPISMSGPLLGPCIEVSGRDNSDKFCF